MSKINNFDKGNLQEIRSELKEALKAVEEKFGIGFSMGTFTFDPMTKSFTYRTECSVIDEDLIGNPEATRISKARAVFKRVHTLYGLKEEDLGKQVSTNGYVSKIVGINESKKKMPIVMQVLQGPKKGALLFASKGYIDSNIVEEL